MTSPEDCPTGYYCPSKLYFEERGLTYEKIACPIGTYQPNLKGADSTACLACDAQKYCPTEGLATYAGSCDAGYYCKQNAEVANPSSESPYGYFGPCPAGYYCPSGDNSAPTACPVGTFSPEEQATSSDTCITCPEGKYCGSEGLSAPEGDCDPGYYCPEG